MKKFLLTALAPVLALVPGMASAGEAENCDVARQSFELKQAEAVNPAILAIQDGVFASADEQERRVETNQERTRLKIPDRDVEIVQENPNIKIKSPSRVERQRQDTNLKIPDRDVEIVRENPNIKIKYARPEVTDQIANEKGTRRIETQRPTLQHKADD